ncbi:hypothetical protein B0H17DRAFT_1189697 [Mycena rosella]|uniref:Uncharacterized protein n=1 Tax=Mycena rosella TaxID=1033263 RepID=A0AAD7F8S2_MYCRO|nr:hypothetical protein B0H17DRAFT_1189697 [Mycena rosella]
MDIVQIIQDQLSLHVDTAAVKFKQLCEDLEGVLQNILKVVQQLQTEPRGISKRFKEVMKTGSTADKISAHRTKIQELRSNFMACFPPKSLKASRNVLRLRGSFTGDKSSSIRCSNFLKWIWETAHFPAAWTRGFWKDTNCTEIHPGIIISYTRNNDTGLKNIAATRNVGSTADDALSG